MKCPFCSSKTRIYNSRPSHQGTQTWRRHVCTARKHTFTTREKIDWTGSTKVKTNSGTSPYSRERLLLSVAKAGEKLNLQPAMLAELCDSIEHELQHQGFFSKNEQEASVIIEASTSVLVRYDQNLVLQYVNQVYASKPPLELVQRLIAPRESS